MTLISCSKEDILNVTPETSEVTFNLSTVVPATKTANLTRYIVEVYKTSDTNTRLQRVEQASGTFVVNLELDINYTCLFWADEVAPNDNTNGTYNALDLKNVTLNSGKIMHEAFFAKYEMTTATTSLGVTLKRATAQINFVEVETVTANTDLQVTFNQYPSFNALTSDAIGTAASTTRTFNSTVTAGTIGTVTTFASVAGITTNFVALYDATVTNEMLNVPLKANYITNIRGTYATSAKDFSFTIELDNDWIDMMPGVHINVGTAEAPSWIKVADRNAEKDGLFGATAGNSETDYGDYYEWSNASNDASNADKAYRACFDYGSGNGSWRLPTEAEWDAVTNGYHDTNANRKIQFESGVWRLYDERAGQTANFVIFPMSGHENSIGNLLYLTERGYYWSSTSHSSGSSAFRLAIRNDGIGFKGWEYTYNGLTVRCVKNVEQ